MNLFCVVLPINKNYYYYHHQKSEKIKPIRLNIEVHVVCVAKNDNPSSIYNRVIWFVDVQKKRNEKKGEL